MKKSRLLEIIREEISSALDETLYSGPNSLKEPVVQKALSKMQGQEKSDAIKGITTGANPINLEEKYKKIAEKYQLDEETINEMASIKQLKSELARQGKEAELKAVTDAERAALDTLKADPTITSDGRLKGYVPTLKKELLNTHNIKLQDLLSKVAGKAEDDGVKFSSDIATNTIEKDAANQLTGKEPGQRGRKADPNKPEKPASTGKKGRPAGEPKAKVATRTPGADGFDKIEYSDVDGEDKEATQNIGSDSTAKELGTLATGKEDTFNRILGLVTKYKDDKAKVDAFISKAENEYKLPNSLLKQLKLAAGRDVEI
jgi:hypothetical protein